MSHRTKLFIKHDLSRIIKEAGQCKNQKRILSSHGLMGVTQCEKQKRTAIKNNCKVAAEDDRKRFSDRGTSIIYSEV